MIDSVGVAAMGQGQTPGAADKAGGLKQDFLNLLVTQLKQQDPMNPSDSASFVAQLAQFTQLESTKNVEQAMYDLSVAGVLQANTQAANFIGKQVTVRSDTLEWGDDGKPAEIGYVLDGKADKVTFEILDDNGEVIRTEVLTAEDMKGPGLHKFQWEAEETNRLKAGNYTFRITAEDADGDPVGVPETQVTTMVDSVALKNNIAHYVLGNGQTVLLGDLRELFGAE